MKDQADVVKEAPKQTGNAGSGSPTVQFRQQVANMPYGQQVEAIQPEVNQMHLQQKPLAEPGASAAATADSDAQIQFTGPPGTVTPETQDRVESQGLEWRTATYKGRVVGHYVVAVEGTPGNSSGGEVPAELAGYSLAAEPQLEAWCLAFESALGQQAFASEGKPASRAMAGKAVEIVDAYVARLRDSAARQDQLEGLFGRILGKDATNFAGAVGLDDATVRAAAGGNLREQMTLSINFLYQFGADWATRKGLELDQFIADAQAIVTSVENPTSQLAESLRRLQMDDNKDTWLFPDDTTIAQQQSESRVRSPNPDTRTDMTAGDLGRAQLSEREIAHMRLQKDNIEAQRLTWTSGKKVWLINEAQGFVQSLRDVSVPLGGGVSGTTGRIMDGAQALGVNDPLGVRAAAIGYLIPIEAHTLWEVVMAAAAYGTQAPASDFSFYMSIQPFNTNGVYSNPEFWKLVATTNHKMNR